MLTSKKIAVLLLSASISLGAFEAQAAKNLVSATLPKAGVDAGFTAALESQLRIGIVYPVAYHLTNNVGIDIQSFAVKPVLTGPAKFDVVSNDCPAVLPVGASCDFTGNVIATAGGEVTLQIHLVEGGNTFLLHKDVATAVPQAPNLVVESSTLAEQYFANNSISDVRFTFKNTGVDTAVVSSVNITNPAVSGASVPLLSQIINNCNGATIASGASCTITGKVSSGNAAATYNLNFNFNYHEASSGSDVLKADFPFTVTMVDTSSLTMTSNFSKLEAHSGDTVQGNVTLENTGKGPVVNIVPSLSNTAEVNGTLAVVESPVAPCSNVLLPGQSCDEVVAFTASKDGSGEGTLSYKSALATLTINYQDGKNSKPLQQSVLAIQLDTGYVQNVLPSAASAMAFANNTLYVGTPANGLFMSSDHGTTWIDAQMFNGLSGNDVVAVSANGNQVAVATSNGIALSLDGGFDFQPQAWVAGGIPQAIAQVTSDNITTLYVGTTTGLYRGTFGGVFMPVEVVPTNVTALGIDLQGDVYAIANQVLYVKTNNSNSFVAATQVSGCAQINGVSVAWERTFFASNCGMVYVTNGASTLAKAGPAGTDLSALAVTGSNASFYGIDSAGSNVLIWNNDGNPWALNPTKNPANIIVLDSKGGYLYVGSSTGGFAIGIIDANDASKVTFP